jgi:hypothetical protein
MRRFLALGLLGLFSVLTSTACSQVPGLQVLYAQSLPVTLHASWNANPVGENIVKYQLAVDAAPLLDVTGLTTAFSVSTLGVHAVKVRACNLAVSVDPASIQCSPYSTTANFTVSAPPATAPAAPVVTQ